MDIPMSLQLVSTIAAALLSSGQPPTVASVELAQIWNSSDCRVDHVLVATVPASEVALEVEKYSGCNRIEYVIFDGNQASASQDARERSDRRRDHQVRVTV
jgi:hypothetical protein